MREASLPLVQPSRAVRYCLALTRSMWTVLATVAVLTGLALVHVGATARLTERGSELRALTDRTYELQREQRNLRAQLSGMRYVSRIEGAASAAGLQQVAEEDVAVIDLSTAPARTESGPAQTARDQRLAGAGL